MHEPLRAFYRSLSLLLRVDEQTDIRAQRRASALRYLLCTTVTYYVVNHVITMKSLVPATVGALLLVLSFAVIANATESRFLKEILLGRCYFAPPTGSDDACPTIVGGIVGAIEGRLDKEITTKDFSQYLDSVDFTVEHPLFWPSKGLGRADSSKDRNRGRPVIIEGWTTPEMTPGGSLLDQLSFCGADKRLDCPPISGASSAFWHGVYANYAQHVNGSLPIIIEEDGSHLDPLLTSAIPNLQVSGISSVTIYSNDCFSSSDVQTIRNALLQQGFPSDSVSCVPLELASPLLVCTDPQSSAACECLQKSQTSKAEKTIPDPESASSPSQQASKTEKRVPTGGVVILIVFLAVVIGMIWTTRQAMNGHSSYESLPEGVQPTMPKAQ